MPTELSSGGKRGRGRPRGFDRQRALQEAMKLFWDQGYEGTSFDDLTAAMCISPSSFYNSFGSKEQLYREAMTCYISGPGSWFARILSETTATRAAFERLIEVGADRLTSDDLPCGCMVSLEGTHLPPSLDSVREALTAYRAVSEKMLVDRLRRGVESGDVPPDTDINALAAFFSAVFRGMAVQARDGASRDRLLEIGRVAMRAWPAKPRRRTAKVRPVA